MKSLISIFITSLLSANQAFADTAEEIAVCHYAEDIGQWELIEVLEENLDNHLDSHDRDVVAPEEGETAEGFNGSVLNSDCNEVEDPAFYLQQPA